MADERSRSPRRDIVWVKVKDGNAVMIKLSQMEAPQNVFNLLEAVKTKVQPDLEAVAIDKLQLFQNERAKNDSKSPIANNMCISDLVGVGSFEEPLYVFHGASLRETSVEHVFCCIWYFTLVRVDWFMFISD